MRISDWSSDVCSSDLQIGVDRVFGACVHQMQQHAAPLDMAKEAVPDADAVGSPFDQAGDVGDHELAALVAHHAKLGFQRGEGIVAHLRLGIGDGIEEGGLDRKSTRLNSSHSCASRMPSYA